MKPRRHDRTADLEGLSMTQLLSLHERMFGPLAPQAKTRLERAARSDEPPATWVGMDGLAA
jgi:hypothetical protein